MALKPVSLQKRDLIEEENSLTLCFFLQEKVEWREVIEKRLLMPTFPDVDSVMFPDDPLGRHGPG